MRSLVKILVISVLLFAFGCSRSDIETQYANQETRIESFLSAQLEANPEAYTVSNEGVERLVLVEGEGAELAGSGTVSFYWAGYVLNGNSLNSNNLFATNVEELASAAGMDTSDTETYLIQTLDLSETDMIEGLRKGIRGVKGGQECIILFSGKYGYGNKSLGTIPANAALAFHLWVESVSND